MSKQLTENIGYRSCQQVENWVDRDSDRNGGKVLSYAVVGYGVQREEHIGECYGDRNVEDNGAHKP